MNVKANRSHNRVTAIRMETRMRLHVESTCVQRAFSAKKHLFPNFNNLFYLVTT